MSDTTRKRLLPRTVIAGALALGIVGGGYGIASAASGTGATTTASTAAAPATPTLPALAPSASDAQQGWGGQRSDETLLPAMPSAA
jgi:hypothetical protein